MWEWLLVIVMCALGAILFWALFGPYSAVGWKDPFEDDDRE